MAAAAVGVLLLSSSVLAQTYNRIEKDLYAGQHIWIGKLYVEQYNVGSAKYLRVTYDTRTSGWAMTTTHLYVGATAPKKSAPGQFPFKHEGLNYVTQDVYEIPLSTFGTSVTQLYIAAHADTCELSVVPDWEATAALLPQTYTLSVVTSNHVTGYQYLDPQASYPEGVPVDFPIWSSWCVSARTLLQKNMPLPTEYALGFLSDGSPNPGAVSLLGPSAVSFASDPIHLLTYLINQPYVRNVGTSGSPFNAWEIQFAIWHITDGIPVDYYPAVADPANVAWILTDVVVNAPAFTPRPGDLVAAFARPHLLAQDGSVSSQIRQPLLFGVELQGRSTSGSCETAWAKGTVGFKTGWGSYFGYNVQ